MTTACNNIIFIENGKLQYNIIVYPDHLDNIIFNADGTFHKKDRYNVELKNSVLFLKTALVKMTGDDNVHLLPESQYKGEKAIVLSVDENADTTKQGYALNINHNFIKIASVFEQGVTNGIFSFLEDSLGCMFLAADCDYIPCYTQLLLPQTKKINNPDVVWRSVYGKYAEIDFDKKPHKDDLGWHTKLRLNGAGFDDWKNWCHSSFTYISPDAYFNEHPEYFSLFNGERTYKQGPVSGQLCWTNEDVYKIISEKVFREMAENPDVHIWDVSQMDTWIGRGVGCQCEKCSAIDRREGTQMGSLLTFINRLADACAEKFPENYISTLAYTYTRKPPKNLRPRDNVIIKLCLMPGDVETDYKNPKSKWAKDAHTLVADWGKIAKHILIWDYNVDYHGYFMPFPIIDSMIPNNNFYLENNVYGIFHQMAYETRALDSEIHTYLFSHLMWDKNTDVEKLAEKFINIYYGKAAPYIWEYFNAVQKNAHTYGQPLYIYAKADAYALGYLSNKCLHAYEALLHKALNAVQEDEIYRNRVQRECLGVLYTRAKRFSLHKTRRKAALDAFYRICRENAITTTQEGTPDNLQTFYKEMTEEIRFPKASVENATAFSQFVKYSFYRVFHVKR